MKLLGAREFIKMPAGTFYIEYWKNTVEECIQIINKFKEDSASFLNIEPTEELCVFGDNSGSMSFSDGIENNYIFYYDANVVGDASPETTLYLVIDENELPDKISIYNSEGNVIRLSKNKIIKIRDYFVNKVYSEYNDDEWAYEKLNKLSREGNEIVDINILG